MTISHRHVDNALNPAWRDAAVHLISSVSWDDTIPEDEAEKAIASVTNGTGYALRQLAPDSGVYYNEVWILSISTLFSHTFIIGTNTNLIKDQPQGAPLAVGLLGAQLCPSAVCEAEVRPGQPALVSTLRGK